MKQRNRKPRNRKRSNIFYYAIGSVARWSTEKNNKNNKKSFPQGNGMKAVNRRAPSNVASHRRIYRQHPSTYMHGRNLDVLWPYIAIYASVNVLAAKRPLQDNLVPQQRSSPAHSIESATTGTQKTSSFFLREMSLRNYWLANAPKRRGARINETVLKYLTKVWKLGYVLEAKEVME